MKILKYSVIIVFVLAIGVSCKNLKILNVSVAVNDTTNIQKNGLFDPQWRGFLEASKNDMKTVWLSTFDPTNAFLNPGYAKIYNLMTTPDELLTLEVIPVESFVIDSASFANWTPDTPIESLLKLKKDEASCFFVKGKTFFYGQDLKYANNQWKSAGYGPVFKNLSDTISTLYFEKNIRLFWVHVETRPNGYRFSNIAYQKNGVLNNLKFGGNSKLLRDDLARLKRKGTW